MNMFQPANCQSSDSLTLPPDAVIIAKLKALCTFPHQIQPHVLNVQKAQMLTVFCRFGVALQNSRWLCISGVCGSFLHLSTCAVCSANLSSLLTTVSPSHLLLLFFLSHSVDSLHCHQSVYLPNNNLSSFSSSVLLLLSVVFSVSAPANGGTV